MGKKRVSFLILGVLILLAYLIIRPYYIFLTDTIRISPLKILFSKNDIKKVNQEVNILVLGVPGGSHDGPNLSDSIIFANYSFKKNRLITLSIPRDIWSDTLRDRINSAYAYGEDKADGGGFTLAKAEVTGIVGMPIQYAFVINFAQFDELVDYLGGIDVDVKKSFTDPEFPVEGKENDLCGGDPEFKCRYETLSFKAGKQHMDGKTALKFVRSRHAEGSEGSDFARGQRQQIVMEAMKDKITAIVRSGNLKKLRELYNNFDRLVGRDMHNQQVALLLKSIVLKGDFYQKSFHFPEDTFEVPDYRLYDGKYVLIPKDNDFTAVHNFISCFLDKEDEKQCPTP